MALRMARPVKLNSSSSIYFRERIPADVIERVRGSTLLIPVGGEVARVVVGTGATHVKLSLRTPARQEGQNRHREVAAHLSRHYENLRNGPISLTHKQAVALSGEVYADWTAALENDPHSAELWKRVEEENRLAGLGDFGTGALLIGKNNRRAAALEERFGRFVDVVLARHGLTVDPPSRRKVVEQVANALTLAARRLQQNANADYSPDANLTRFGQFEVQSATATSNRGLIWDELIDRWAKEARPKQATADQWRGYMRDLADVTGIETPASLAKTHVIKWKDVLVDRGGAVKTINDSKLAALKTLLNWGAGNGHVAANVAQGVRVRQKRKAGASMLGFSDEQASAILSAAFQSKNAVRRWVPFLCALSGARVAEIAQLRRQDLKRKDGIAYLQLRPEAGSLKNANSERDVPLHPYLVETGFVSFVEARRDGPLFYDPARRRADAKKPPAKIVAKNLAAWVGKLDIGVGRSNRIDPNHGWRHWFKTTARAHGIQDSVVDHIQGHAPATTGQGYGESSLRAKFEAISKIPVPGAAAAPARVTTAA